MSSIFLNFLCERARAPDSFAMRMWVDDMNFYPGKTNERAERNECKIIPKNALKLTASAVQPVSHLHLVCDENENEFVLFRYFVFHFALTQKSSKQLLCRNDEDCARRYSVFSWRAVGVCRWHFSHLIRLHAIIASRWHNANNSASGKMSTQKPETCFI